MEKRKITYSKSFWWSHIVLSKTALYPKDILNKGPT